MNEIKQNITILYCNSALCLEYKKSCDLVHLIRMLTHSYAILELVSDWAVDVAHLVEWSLPIPEVRGSNPVNNNILLLNICLLSTVLKG